MGAAVRAARPHGLLRTLLSLLSLALWQCDDTKAGEAITQANRRVAQPLASAPLPPSPLPLPDDLPASAPFALSPRTTEPSSSVTDGGTVAKTPSRLRPGQVLDADTMKERELPGIRLEGEWRHAEPAQLPRAPEGNASGMEAARKQTALKWTIDLAEAGRMRLRLVSRAFALPHGTELRARADHFGHILVWPDGSRYRALPPGTLRTLLGERRADVTPLGAAQLGETTKGTRRFGLSTRRTEYTTRTGRLALDMAKVAEVGEGGALLCRLLMEIVGIDPGVAPCLSGEVPLRAQFSWPTGGGVAFEVTALQHRPDIPASLLAMPPSATSAVGELPPSPSIFLTGEELAALRSRDKDAPSPSAGSSNQGLLAFNGTDAPRYLLVDSIPLAWIGPWREEHIPHLPDGRYAIGWRTFFGEVIEPAGVVELPARIATGLVEAPPSP